MNISKRTQSLLDRLPKDHPRAASMRTAMESILAASEQFAGRKIALSSDGRMTQRGQQQALQEALVNEFGKALAAAYAPVTRARMEWKVRKAALTVKAVDPQNIAAALERQEIRAWVRQLDDGVRESVVLATKDRRILEAVLLAAPELSGSVMMNAESAAKVKARYLEITYPDDLAEIEAENEVLAHGEMANQIALDEMRAVVDLHPHDFGELLKSIEPERPLLTRDRSQVIVIGADGKASYRAANADERANGEVYDPHKAARAA